MEIISHRGLWWPDPAKQNTPEALDAALAAGYGVEFDLRHDSERGCLVLAHDPVAEHSVPPSAESWLAARLPTGPPLFVNIKEPGTEREIVDLLAKCDLLGRAWLFDFELCGADPNLAQVAHPSVRCLRRTSDRAEPPFADHGAGVWMDQWDGDWITAADIAAWKWHGPVFLVAPDLHGRAFDLGKLEHWRGADGICTDIPHLLAEVLRANSPVHPTEPWWGE